MIRTKAVMAACAAFLASRAGALASPEETQSSGKAPQETRAQGQQSGEQESRTQGQRGGEQARAAQVPGERATPLSASQQKVLEDWQSFEQTQQRVP